MIGAKHRSKDGKLLPLPWQHKDLRLSRKPQQAPSAVMAWAAPTPGAARLVWPLSKLQTQLVIVAMLGLAVIVLIMMFPGRNKLGPAWPIYYFHDAFVLPFRGRIFERYAPVPQISIVVIVALGLGALFLRKFAVEAYDGGLRLMLGFIATRKLLASWADRVPADAPLYSALETRYRHVFAEALQEKSAAKAAVAHDLATFILDLPTGPEGRRGIARAALCARDMVLFHAVSQPAANAKQERTLSGNFGPFAAALTSGNAKETSIDDRAHAIETAWNIATKMEQPSKDLAVDAVLWIAVLSSLRENDAALSRMIQQRIAALSLERALNRDTVQSGPLCFDPLVWHVDPGLAVGQALPGMAMSGDTINSLLGELNDYTTDMSNP